LGGLLNVFDVRVNFGEHSGPTAYVTTMDVLKRESRQVGYVSPHHATLAASVADIVDAAGSHH